MYDEIRLATEFETPMIRLKAPCNCLSREPCGFSREIQAAKTVKERSKQF